MRTVPKSIIQQFKRDAGSFSNDKSSSCRFRTAVCLAFFLFGQLLVYRKVNHWIGEINAHQPDFEQPSSVSTSGRSFEQYQLAKQVQIQNEFHQMVRDTQTPNNCGEARILKVVPFEKEFDGFALEARTIAWFLQIAVATNRSLVVTDEVTSAYAPYCESADPNNPPTMAPTSDPDPEVSIGQKVSFYEHKKRTWYNGKIRSHQDNVYTVEWKDGSEEDYADSGPGYRALQQAILDADRDDDRPPPFSSFIQIKGKFLIKWRKVQGYPSEFDNYEDAFLALRKVTMANRKPKPPRGGLLRCLWNPVSNCTVDENIKGMTNDEVLPQPLGAGIFYEKYKRPLTNEEKAFKAEQDKLKKEQHKSVDLACKDDKTFVHEGRRCKWHADRKNCDMEIGNSKTIADFCPNVCKSCETVLSNTGVAKGTLPEKSKEAIHVDVINEPSAKNKTRNKGKSNKEIEHTRNENKPKKKGEQLNEEEKAEEEIIQKLIENRTSVDGPIVDPDSRNTHNKNFTESHRRLEMIDEDDSGDEDDEDDDDSEDEWVSASNSGDEWVGAYGHGSFYFDAKYYGRQRVVQMEYLLHTERVKLPDVLPHWERQYGRFWVRSQITDFFWKHATSSFKGEIESRLPHSLLALNEPFVAFHIRMTDNVHDLAHDFGRNATITRSFERFMAIANNIQSENPGLKHIYVATDNEDAAARALKGDGQYPGWTFHIQSGVKRSSATSEFMWFRNKRAGTSGAIGADVETLRRADFLVGSFQSNVFRLAAELNTGYHTSRYLWDKKRIYSVDIEWYEDP